MEVIRRRLEKAEQTLRQEREKRRQSVAVSRARIAALQEEKKRLKTELATARRALAEMLTAKKEEERAARRKLKMEQARDEAVASFVQRWEKKYLAKQASTTGKRRRKRVKRSSRKA